MGKAFKIGTKWFLYLCRKIFQLLIILFFCFLIFWFLMIPIANEMILHQYKKELLQYDIGSEYTVIESASVCGKLYGNGNGMDYLAVALIESDAVLEEQMPDYGEGIYILAVDHKEWLDGVLRPHNDTALVPLREKLEALQMEAGTYYVIYSLNSAPYDSVLTWDLRGH